MSFNPDLLFQTFIFMSSVNRVVEYPEVSVISLFVFLLMMGPPSIKSSLGWFPVRRIEVCLVHAPVKDAVVQGTHDSIACLVET